MKRRDILWMAGIWIALLMLAATLAAIFPDPDGDPATRDASGYFLLATVVGVVATGLYVLVRRRPQHRRDILWIAGIWFVVLALAFTVAAAFPDDDPTTDDASGAGALAAVVGALATGLYFFVRERSRARERRDVPQRECPSCRAAMPAEAGRCPHCEVESRPWTHHAGVWWVQSGSGAWQWLDERSGFWRWYRDGTPSTPTVTDTTPSLAIDPAVVDPPAAGDRAT